MISLVQTYYSSGYDVQAILSQIFHSKAFYSEKARFAVIKSPAQYVVGTVKMLGLDKAVELILADITPANDMAVSPSATPTLNALTPAPALTAPAVTQQAKGRKLGVLAGLPLAMRSMGQDLLAPPSVKGWDGGEAWINTSTLLARINFANTVSLSRQMFGGRFLRATAFVQENNLTPEGWVDYLAEALGPLPLTATTRQALIDYIKAPETSGATVQNAQFTATAPDPLNVPFRQGKKGNGGGRYQRLLGAGPGGLEGRLRGVIPLIMATPEYQVC